MHYYFRGFQVDAEDTEGDKCLPRFRNHAIIWVNSISHLENEVSEARRHSAISLDRDPNKADRYFSAECNASIVILPVQL